MKNLRYDPLRADPLRADPLSPDAIMPEYDKKLGFTVMPGQREQMDKFHQGILGRVAQERGALAKYQDAYKTGMATANAKAQGLLGKMPGHKYQEKVPVYITSGGPIESKVMVNKNWADNNLPGNKNSPGSFKKGTLQWNFDKESIWSRSKGLWEAHPDWGGYRIDAHGYGKELRDMLNTAAAQTSIADTKFEAYNEASDKSKKALQYQMQSLKKTAQDRYDFEVQRANSIIAATEGQWTSYISNMRANFIKGQRTNTGGVADLLKSGALVF